MCAEHWSTHECVRAGARMHRTRAPGEPLDNPSMLESKRDGLARCEEKSERPASEVRVLEACRETGGGQFVAFQLILILSTSDITFFNIVDV